MSQLRLIEVSTDHDSPYWEIACPARGVAQFTAALSEANPAIRAYVRVYHENGAPSAEMVALVLPKRVIKKSLLTECVAQANEMLKQL